MSDKDKSTTKDDDNNNKNDGNDDDDDDSPRVVLEQTLLKVEECFVYQIPPMRSSGGHRAEDWNLAKPLATCSLTALRRNSSLYLNLMTSKPKVGGPKGATEPHLFAQSHIHLLLDDKSFSKMEHWVEAVVDSSRYFVVRIRDNRSGREAHIGMGFRDRNDAINFRMCLQEYENALRRERKAEAMHVAYETSHSSDDGEEAAEGEGGGEGKGEDRSTSPLPSVSKLTLKEGEKIHINLKGTGGGASSPHRSRPKKSSNDGGGGGGGGGAVGKGGLLLRKPPPPATSAAAAATVPPPPSPPAQRPPQEEVAISPGGIKIVTEGSNGESLLKQDEGGPGGSGAAAAGGKQRTGVADGGGSSVASSTAAVADTIDEDDWGDFESGT